MGENYTLEGCKAIGQRIGGFCVQNKAHLCTGVSVTGTIATGVLAWQSGARTARKIDRREAEIGRRLEWKEKMKLCGKDIIAPVVAGGLAIFGSVESDVINTRTIGERTALYIASEKAYEKLSEKTKEVLGEKKARQVQDEVAKEKVEKMEQAGMITPYTLENAPRCGSGALYPYIDGYSELLFWSNPDYISLTIKNLNEMMRDLAPRGDEYDYYDKIVGIPYSEWLKSIGFDRKIWSTIERKHTGWNKGFAKDGSDDDPIEYFITSKTLEPEGMPVNVINWEKDPTDMRLGRLIKSNNM